MLLKVPRLHFNYIKENGVDEFVARCREYVNYHDHLYEEEERSKERIRARETVAIEKFDNSSLSNSFKKASKDYIIEQKRPPFILTYPEKMKKTPSPPLRRPQSDLKTHTYKQNDKVS